MLLRNILLAIGAAAVLAGLLLAALQLKRTPEPVEAEKPAAVRPAVLAASHELPMGTLLRKGDVAWREVEPGEIRPGNIVRGQALESEVLGSITRRDFAEGEPLAAAELVKPGDRRFLATALRPGMRAASVTVDSPQGLAGLVFPDDRVDVILTQAFGDKATPGKRFVSETVVRDARVIAVDQTLAPPVDSQGVIQRVPGAEVKFPKTVTLELSERQAETLLVAAQLGRFQLAVRPLAEAGAARGAERAGPSPVWGGDVSAALEAIDDDARLTAKKREEAELAKEEADADKAAAEAASKKAEACKNGGAGILTGSTIECFIRRPPAFVAARIR